MKALTFAFLLVPASFSPLLASLAVCSYFFLASAVACSFSFISCRTVASVISLVSIAGRTIKGWFRPVFSTIANTMAIIIYPLSCQAKAHVSHSNTGFSPTSFSSLVRPVGGPGLQSRLTIPATHLLKVSTGMLYSLAASGRVILSLLTDLQASSMLSGSYCFLFTFIYAMTAYMYSLPHACVYFACAHLFCEGSGHQTSTDFTQNSMRCTMIERPLNRYCRALAGVWLWFYD